MPVVSTYVYLPLPAFPGFLQQFLERALALLPAEGDLHSVLIKQMGSL